MILLLLCPRNPKCYCSSSICAQNCYCLLRPWSHKTQPWGRLRQVPQPFKSSSRDSTLSCLMVFAQGRHSALGFSPPLLFLSCILDWLKVNPTTACLQPARSSPAEANAGLPQPSCLALPGCQGRQIPLVSSSPWPSTSLLNSASCTHQWRVKKGEGCHNFPLGFRTTRFGSSRGH